jgi:hypothetical protein
MTWLRIIPNLLPIQGMLSVNSLMMIVSQLEMVLGKM